MIWCTLKNIFLGFFGVAVIAMGIMITSHFDDGLLENDFFIMYISITWSAYIISKGYWEYNKFNNHGK